MHMRSAGRVVRPSRVLDGKVLRAGRCRCLQRLSAMQYVLHSYGAWSNQFTAPHAAATLPAVCRPAAPPPTNPLPPALYCTLWSESTFAHVCAQVYDCHTALNQRWNIDTLGRIHSRKLPDRCLDVTAGMAVVTTCSTAATQRFDQLGEPARTTYAQCNTLTADSPCTLDPCWLLPLLQPLLPAVYVGVVHGCTPTRAFVKDPKTILHQAHTNHLPPDNVLLYVLTFLCRPVCVFWRCLQSHHQPLQHQPVPSCARGQLCSRAATRHCRLQRNQ